jgi:hypothetical protein
VLAKPKVLPGVRPAQPEVWRPYLRLGRDAKHPPRKGPGRMRWQPGLSVARPLARAARWAVVVRPARLAAQQRAARALRGVALPRPALAAAPLLAQRASKPNEALGRAPPVAWRLAALGWPQPHPAHQSPRDCPVGNGETGSLAGLAA